MGSGQKIELPESDMGSPLPIRSEEHTSELQSPYDLVCRLLLEKKKREQRDAQGVFELRHPGAGAQGPDTAPRLRTHESPDALRLVPGNGQRRLHLPSTDRAYA